MPVNPDQPIEQLLIDVHEFTPVLPDTVSHLLLSRSGLDTEHDPRIARIASLAAQKFISDILLDARQVSLNRANKEMRNAGSKSKDKPKNVLTMEDLSQATEKIGITIRKPPYYH
ncbi:Oidioi.mRNA.OKI2018_I69.chr2.g5670.t1.cds [Oikopleura dioica]|uniref:Oidioi.mRNA.OKI2018_I69.chr2.g5670.t1.cds n=1 Tax=Oikopleura dioica TaxID=34765 RepID=A0ABN7T5E9_OIKDI|nr:Oidioi.mRNA.OKI2018_I69.chr2.g5670.t1.cds [Oikopleura dioica]